MPRRLAFKTFDDAITEAISLHRCGWHKEGKWDLSQTCDHLTFFMAGSLDGHQFKVPWVFKVLFGRRALGNILKNRQMGTGKPTPQKALPQPGGDEAESVARFVEVARRVHGHVGEFADSPFFGHLTPDQWRDLHLIHCAHHLGFLSPM